MDPRNSLTLWPGEKAISSARISTVNPQSSNNFLQLRTGALIPTSLYNKTLRKQTNKQTNKQTKKKGKVNHKTGHEARVMEDSYSSTICFTSALDEGVRSTTRPGRFTPGKETWNPFYRRLDGPQGQSERVWKISPPSGFEEVLIYKKYLIRCVYFPKDVTFLLY